MYNDRPFPPLHHYSPHAPQESLYKRQFSIDFLYSEFEFRSLSNKMTLHTLLIALNDDEEINIAASTFRKNKVSVEYVTIQ